MVGLNGSTSTIKGNSGTRIGLLYRYVVFMGKHNRMPEDKKRHHAHFDGLSQHRMQQLGSYLRQCRFEQCLSLDEMSKKSGISKSLLQKIEASEKNCTVLSLFRICDFFKISPEELFKGVE